MKDSFIIILLFVTWTGIGYLLGRETTIKALSKNTDMKEYQVELDMDTVRVYQYGRYVDCYIIENGKLNQFDEICAIDNR